MFHAKHGALRCKDFARKLHFFVRWDVVRNAVGDFEGVKTHIAYIRL